MLHVRVSKQRGAHRLEVEFSAPAGAAVAVFGPSGCGKTTLLDIVAGLLAPDAARIEIGGELLCDTARGLRLPPERRRLGYVFQHARLFPHLDVRRNLEFGLRRNRAAGTPIAFDDVVALLGIGSLLARRPDTLSGGERQRVALGRALLAQPRMLLLDEPLAALDGARRDEVLPYIARLREHWNLPMLYVSHQFDEVARLATHLAVLQDGRLTAFGPLQEVALGAELRGLIDESAVGAVLDAQVVSRTADGRATVSLGAGTLTLAGLEGADGDRVRVRVLARDVMLSTRAPGHIGARHVLAGTVTEVRGEGPHHDLVGVDVGGAVLLARVARDATQALGIRGGLPVWALLTAVSVGGRAL